jgi:hypothetical protein
METFAKSKEEWLKQFLELENGVPAHDTFGDVFGMIDGEEFQRSFIRWVEGVFTVTGGQVVAIDGKTARRSHDKAIAVKMRFIWSVHGRVPMALYWVSEKWMINPMKLPPFPNS